MEQGVADKTKAELYEQALKRRIILNPASSTKDLAENIQLKEREFYVDIEHPEIEETITYAGAPYRFTKTPQRVSRLAPLIGEHNEEILGGELGFSEMEMRRLKENGVI